MTTMTKFTSNPAEAALRAENARLKRRIRDLESGDEGTVTLPEGLVIDHEQWRASFHGTEVKLTSKEFDLLAMLATRPRRVFDKKELLRSCWGNYAQSLDGGRTRTLDSHACRLRTALRTVDPTHDWVVAVWGIGYALLRDDWKPVQDLMA